MSAIIPFCIHNDKERTASSFTINSGDKDGKQINGDLKHHSPTAKNLDKDDDDDDDGDDDIVCGVGSFTPSRLQSCMSMGHFTAFYSVAGLLTSALNVYISSQITTLEKYYNFSSSVSGFLMSCNDIGYLMTTLFMSYYSRRVHIPRGLSLSTFVFGVSGILCVLAFALTKDEHASVTKFHSLSGNSSSAAEEAHNSVAQLCVNVTSAYNISGQGDLPDAGGISGGWRGFALLILAVGMFIQGIAKSPRHSFLGTYVDDNVPKTMTTKYIGLISGFGIFGPAMAFILGGIFSRIYVTLEDPGITTRDPRWVGAWWLGFLVFGGASVIASLPLACFPRRLKGRRQIKGVESKEKGGAYDEKKTTKVTSELKGFFKSGRRLLTNPVYTLVVLGTSINLTGVAGFMAFAAKYLETQFTVPVFKANMTLGTLNVAAAALGTVIGGFITSKLKLSPRACLKFTLVCYTVSSVVMGLSFVLGCDQPDIHKANPSLTTSGGRLSTPGCAADCNCDTENFFPVCGADKRNYFSPCHAGCTNVLGSNVFVNCSCVFNTDAAVDSVPLMPPTSKQTATAGLCTPDCNTFYPYMAAMFFMAFFATLAIMPTFVIYVRSVSEKDKPLAIGFFAFSTTVLAWLPSPVIFGILVDSCCEIWNSAGACSLYHLPTFRFRYHFLVLLLRVASLTLFVIVFVFVTFSKTFEFQSHTDEEEEHQARPPGKAEEENGKFEHLSANLPFNRRTSSKRSYSAV
ncbi:solute carrier organic anion transporter family member [Elysia marginata]|uniref:Solute carrier organic anion transporter family member n=1 Tax=Elysia marginata TaxID=1093978 RepID=A0AAV4ESE7_9GAST|nr:solute carrier organic anion transporter family member [Elysia marginata]